ncbi:MAG TPA: hypothetical protein VMF58_14160 [Rhizomicrobium sp.]|nr:hypothetical protein [Rhizomicrobium sp.]
MEAKLAHLEILQNVIQRMAGNSFLLKGWSVTLVSALFALGADKANPLFVYLAYFPTAMFWALDGYFLRQERLFRAKYDSVRLLDKTAIDFSMDTSSLADRVSNWGGTCFSRTLVLFHGTILGSVLVTMIGILAR